MKEGNTGLSDIQLQLFSLIQIAMDKGDSSWICSAHIEWRTILEEAKKQAIIGVCFEGIKKLPKKCTPDTEVLIEWIALSEAIKEQNRVFDKHSSLLTKTFQEAGVRSTILKGQGYSAIYPGQGIRQCGDIDILVEGEKKQIITYCKNNWEVENIGIKNLVLVNYPEVHVEVHFIPSWFYCPFTNIKFQEWYSRNQEVVFREMTCKGFSIPSLSFDRVFCLVHIYKHMFDEGIGLRQLIDYYCILKSSAKDNPLWSVEKEQSLQTLKSFGMNDFVGAIMYVLKVVVNIEEPLMLCIPNEKLGRKLLSTILEGGNFGHYDEKNQHGKENRIQHGIRNIRHNIYLLKDYPSEVLWSPLWKCWHWAWRKYNGFL